MQFRGMKLKFNLPLEIASNFNIISWHQKFTSCLFIIYKNLIIISSSYHINISLTAICWTSIWIYLNASIYYFLKCVYKV